MVVYCNAQGDDTAKVVRILESLLNETRATRELLVNMSQDARDCCRLSQQWYTKPNVYITYASCEDVKTMTPSAPSGYYNITNYDGITRRIYCDMDNLCGSIGWTRVAYLDMSNPSQQCPTELTQYDEERVRACGRQNSSSASCDSVTFSTNGMTYSQVCGRVIGYQWGAPDAIHPYGGHTEIDSPYIEGVSITSGSPRRHIWTLMAGIRESGASLLECPCNTGSTITVPSFIGNDYFCESANPENYWSPELYTNDPLWDGEGCGGDEGPCCNAPGIPWFHKVFKKPTRGHIELRVCGDYATYEEDTPVSMYEIYVM